MRRWKVELNGLIPTRGFPTAWYVSYMGGEGEVTDAVAARRRGPEATSNFGVGDVGIDVAFRRNGPLPPSAACGFCVSAQVVFPPDTGCE